MDEQRSVDEPENGELGDDVEEPLPPSDPGADGAEEVPPSGEEGSKDEEDVDETIEESFPASDPPGNY
jgi:hypothetical protein